MVTLIVTGRTTIRAGHDLHDLLNTRSLSVASRSNRTYRKSLRAQVLVDQCSTHPMNSRTLTGIPNPKASSLKTTALNVMVTKHSRQAKI